MQKSIQGFYLYRSVFTVNVIFVSAGNFKIRRNEETVVIYYVSKILNYGRNEYLLEKIMDSELSEDIKLLDGNVYLAER